MVQVRKACVVGFNHVALEVGDIEEETIAANAIPIPVPTSVAALRLLFMFRPFVMAVSGASPEITDANLAHESPEAQPDPGTREAKPSAAVTEREEEPVQAERRIVQSQRGAPAKRTVANIGTNEVKPSVFVNLRQAPSPSAKVIRVVAKGTKLRVVARKGRWAQVTDPAASAKGWIYTGIANPPRSTKPSAPAEPSENTQPKPDSVDTQPKSDSIWPSYLRGGLASG